MSQLKNIHDDSLPSWLPRLSGNKGPRFLQIADALQAALVAGSLKPGDRLPPQRLLAAQLDVDLTTITRAYDEARRRNLLEGRGAESRINRYPRSEHEYPTTARWCGLRRHVETRFVSSTDEVRQ